MPWHSPAVTADEALAYDLRSVGRSLRRDTPRRTHERALTVGCEPRARQEMHTMGTLLETFRSNYSATQDAEMSLDEYLDLCKREPDVYATAAERMLAGIGEPELVDTRNDQRLARLFGNRIDPPLPRLPRVLRHGGGDRADRRLLQARGAGPRGEEADPLPAGPGRRRQVLHLRAAEDGDGGTARSTRSRARRSTNRRSASSRPRSTARCSSASTASRAAT